LQPADQRRALAECFPQHKTAAAVLKDKKAEAVTVRSLREWIEREILLDITNAPFDAEDANLLPAAGSCAVCPKRTGNNPLLFPEIRHKSICTDRACYRTKVEAFVQIRVKPLEESGEKPLRVSQAPAWQSKKPQPDVLYEGQYRRIARKGECPHTRPAVVIDGAQAGTVMHVCRDEKCPAHARETRYQPTPQERAARRKELLAERVEKLTRVRILDAIRKKLPGTLARPDLEMAALDYFRRLGHDNHRRLCRVHQWEEKKTKSSWGGMAVDYEAIAGRAVRAMNPQELQRFLVVCALVSDLYCPSFNPRESLGKDSNLARTAVRYKIDPATITTEVRTELAKNAGAKKNEQKKTK
jgi:ParB family chromosome partitioning protein